MYYFYTLLFTSIFTSSLFCEINLENEASTFVLKTKQICIPGYTHAFNPSIIRWEDKILMSFRTIPKNSKINSFCSSADSFIGLVFLDDDFNPCGPAQILDFDCDYQRPEDARLVKVGCSLYLVYSDNRNCHLNDEGFRMHVTEIIICDDKIRLGHTDSILYFEGEDKLRREKNWAPFDYEGNLLMAYSLASHKILYPVPLTDRAESVCTTEANFEWNMGELRGGTPACMDDDEYLAFFHSSKIMNTVHSKGLDIPHYFIGAYTFNKEPPFEITQISKEPIIAEGFYEGEEYAPYWHPVSVVFPCGFITDEHYIYMSYGRQDHEIWIVKLDKKGLKQSLIPVTPK